MFTFYGLCAIINLIIIWKIGREVMFRFAKPRTGVTARTGSIPVSSAVLMH